MRTSTFFLTAFPILCLIVPSHGSRKAPAKVFLVAGDDNVEGFGYLRQLEGLLSNQTFASSAEGEKFAHLKDPTTGRWVERDDVFVVYEHERHKPLRQGRLNMYDYGGVVNETFGPEVEVGHVLGNTFDEPVIIVKAGWSKKSLGHDFLPPSSNGFTGFEWVRAVDAVRDAIKNVDKIVGSRKYRGGRAELAGVIWWHGYGDMVHAHFRDAYQTNLQHLVKDLRRTFHIPYLPIIVGELGGTGDHASDWELQIRSAQKTVCDMPEFNRTTVYVETAKYVNRDPPKLSNNVHYYGRGDTMIEVGNAFAREMLRLMFTHQEFGETENEVEAEFELQEEDEEFGAGMAMIFIIGLVVLVVAVVQRYRSGSDQPLSEFVKSDIWRIVRLFRPGHDDLMGIGKPDKDEGGVEFGSLPGSDSPLYELDSVSSKDDDDHQFAFA